MKRIGICVGIIFVIIISSVMSLNLLKSSNDELFSRLDNIVSDYNNGEDVSDELEDFRKFWRKYYIRLSFTAQSPTLDDISFSVAKLEPLLEKNSDEFVSECESIKYWAYLIYDCQMPSFHSIF